jgi:hypothetical protein
MNNDFLLVYADKIDGFADGFADAAGFMNKTDECRIKLPGLHFACPPDTDVSAVLHTRTPSSSEFVSILVTMSRIQSLSAPSFVTQFCIVAHLILQMCARMVLAANSLPCFEYVANARCEQATAWKGQQQCSGAVQVFANGSSSGRSSQTVKGRKVQQIVFVGGT